MPDAAEWATRRAAPPLPPWDRAGIVPPLIHQYAEIAMLLLTMIRAYLITAELFIKPKRHL
ncbi:hypothetical protein CRT60_05370 [Azospirillum palustre]|uniref:Uncharacterized protein n=1 Tax=Azospirillum palustre TaxID=2044885 RepID=A0A2B8BMX2_9PROT|nr:hypothetical protein CRT60_05370 [Azospirillum palustre]